MFGRQGMLQSVAIGAVIVAVGGWALYTQTDLFRPTPVVQASETPTVTPAPEGAAEPAEQPAEVAVAEVAAEVEDTPEVMEDVAEAIVEASPEAEEAAPVEEQAVLAAPTFDVVRVEADGTTVVAGTGPAGWMISILVDDVVEGTVEADATGQFVAFLDLGISDTARVMTLSAKNGDQILLAEAQILIAPVVQVAEAAPEEAAQPEPEVEAQAPETPEETVAEVEETPTVADVMEEVAEAVTEEVVEQAEAAIDNMFENDAAAAEETVAEDTVVEETVADAVEETAPETASEEAVSEVAEAEAETETSEPQAEVDEVQDAPETAETTEVAEAQEAQETVETEPAQETEPATAEVAAAEETTADTTPEAPAEVAEATPAAPAVVLVEEGAVTVLQPASPSPDVLDQLSIQAISYSDEGAVQLSGFSPAGFLRVYLNNVQIAVLEVLEPGSWSAELVDVEPGVYTLRVDRVDADGTVQQRVETPFQREEPEKVVAAAQTRRPQVTSQVVQPGSTLWAISRENYGSGVLFVRIFEANKDQIRDPDLIYPGQIFDLPAPPGARKTR